MDRLQRHRLGAMVHQAVEAQTQDHMDHTFAGVMFDVRSASILPYEYLEVSAVWVRGGLGPMSVWSVEGVSFLLDISLPHQLLLREHGGQSSSASRRVG